MEREGSDHQEEVIEQTKFSSVEEMIDQSIGQLNSTQIMQTMLTSMSPFFDSFQTFMPIFADAQPTWHCTIASTSCISNKSDLCSLSRSDWAWDSGISTHTSIISEWGLECASSLTTSFPSTSYFVGCLLGGLLLATLGDSSLGRKNLLCISSLLMSLAAFSSAFAPNLWVYSLLRFICGVGRAPLMVCALMLLTERVAKRWRSHVLMVGCINSSLGILALTGIGYLARESSWRTLYLCTSVPTLIFSILAYFLMYESPRWLLLQGRQQDAMDVLTSLGRSTTGQISLNSPLMIRHTQQNIPNGRSNTNPFASLHILISRPWAVKRLIAFMLLSFGIGLMYFGMFLGAGDLGTDIYLTSVLHALLALTSYLVAFLFWIPKCNRRVSLLGYCTLSGATSIVLAIMGNGKIEGILLGMELVSMFSGCMAYNIALMYVVELFPTCVRSSASSLARQTMIFGSVLDPLLVLLGRENLLYSYGVFGLAILLCGFLVLCLPETRGKVLCDTMEEQEFMDNEEMLNH